MIHLIVKREIKCLFNCYDGVLIPSFPLKPFAIRLIDGLKQKECSPDRAALF